MSISSDRINNLAAIFNFKTYLEIGVCTGATFASVRMRHRTGVDPCFRFDVAPQLAIPDTWLITGTSNAFFNALRSNSIERYPSDMKWDLIFIDGLHVFEQALQDFNNSLAYAHDKTIWIFDDTIPSDPYASLRSMDTAYEYRRLAGLKSTAWQGDVFKCVFALHDFFPDFSYATVIDNGNPQTVVWRAAPASRTPVIGSRDAIAKLNYFDLLAHPNVLNAVEDWRMYDLIGSQFNGDSRPAQAILPLIVKKPV